MKLTKVRVTNFQSVRDSNEFSIGDATCMVGKNESGKTAILQAIYRLNPIVGNDSGYSVTTDYPRHNVDDYRLEVEEGGRHHDEVVRLVFELEDADVADLVDELGPKALTSRTVILSRAYEHCEFEYAIQSDDDAVMDYIKGHAEDEPLRTSKTPGYALSQALELEQTPEVMIMVEALEKIAAEGSVEAYIWKRFIEPRVPKFMYFDEYYHMRGCDNIEALKQRLEDNALENPDHPLLGLVRLARLDLDALIEPRSTRDLKNRLEGAGNHLTKSVIKYWSQNKKLQMRFDVRPGQPEDPEGMRSGTNIWAEAYDTVHGVSTEIGSRSKGFVWFFSFLAWYGDVQRDRQNVILLLDEPGLSLHGKAQGDLLRYFEEELVPNHQVIYTTHSPFMVDAERFDRVRIVHDLSTDREGELPGELAGTKVTTDVLKCSEDSLFPLQGALGYDICQTLFVGSNCLIVEGVSDLLYLQTMAGVLRAAGREGLSDGWTITPVGGADKVPTFVALLGAQKSKMNIATLIDAHKENRQEISDMWKEKLIRKENVLTYAEFVKASEADVEDVIGDTFFIELVNAEYAKEMGTPIVQSDLKSRHPRIVMRFDKQFGKGLLPGGVPFNHYRPARYFSEQAGNHIVPTDVLERFEKMFCAVNKLLGKAS